MFCEKKQSPLFMRNSNVEDGYTVMSKNFSDSLKLIYFFISVRGTPGSGKSVLAGLLRRYINGIEPDTEVVFFDAWPENLPVQTTLNMILILDEAQTTYWDKNFWSKFKNPGLQDMRVVAFASHGSSGYTGADNATPMWIGMEQRVGLARVDCGDGILVGLLFTREEFNALVQLRFRDRRFSDSFLDCVFDMTNGHVGACEDLMRTVVAHEVMNPFLHSDWMLIAHLVIPSSGEIRGIHIRYVYRWYPHDLHSPEHLQKDGICPRSPRCGFGTS
jgi:hypothetical protein